MSYPIPFRGHVLRVKDREQLSFAETARRFSVEIASVKRWSKRMDPKPYERKKPRKRDPAALAQDVIDNATFHKRADTRAMIEAAGHRLAYLPPYSPDLNPIEQKWAQAKAVRRRTGLSTDTIFANQNWNQI